VSLIGVWNWRGTNGLGGKAALADWELIPLNERLVYIVFDSDVMVKRAVYQALERLKAFLESRHAHIRLVYLPSEDGRKVGVDDYLVTGKSINDLVDLATTELKQPPRQDREVDLPYCATDHGLIWVKRTDQESVPVPLTNFTAQIVSDLTEDDGAATRRFFEIEACLKHQTRRFTISANQFAVMHWVAEHLGAQAILYPGPAIRDRARVAIQLLSSNIASRQVYSHTGWREIDNQWMFLHEGGAVGPDGSVQGIEVFLPQALKGYRLPDLPEVQDQIGRAHV
jgi:hypothetical protein